MKTALDKRGIDHSRALERSELEALMVQSGKGAVHDSTGRDVPRKADGTPDRRFTVNRAAPAPRETGPLKKDGTPDRRFKANRAPSTGGLFGGFGGGGGGPLKADGEFVDFNGITRHLHITQLHPGTPDMRFKANW